MTFFLQADKFEEPNNRAHDYFVFWIADVAFKEDAGKGWAGLLSVTEYGKIPSVFIP